MEIAKESSYVKLFERYSEVISEIQETNEMLQESNGEGD